MKIKRNKDGARNLNDLRKALWAKHYQLRNQDGRWVAIIRHTDFWYELPMPREYDERKAIESLLKID